MKYIAYLYQLPQHLLALLLIHLLHPTYHKSPIPHYTHNQDFSLSLGQYILISELWYPATDDRYARLLAHEHGHSLQSLYLGPLYLILIGIPSLAMNLLSRKHILNPVNYYRRWPESWADKLGKVKR